MSTEYNIIYILLGANLGNPLVQLQKAAVSLAQNLGKIEKYSSIYETQAWGVEDQPSYYNQVLQISTDKDKEESLLICQQIENELGRVRKEKWGARVIDIDILYFNNEIYNSNTLTIPHPYIQDRNFVLYPLTEIAPDYKHPKLLVTNQNLLISCSDQLLINKIS